MPAPSSDRHRTTPRDRFALGALLLASMAIARAQPSVPATPATFRTQTQTIHGRVVADDNGNALPNARLFVDADEGRASAASDGEGRFALTAPANATNVSVSKAGFATARVPIGDGLEIRLPRGAAIVGHVTDDSGGPLPLMIVVAERRRVVDGRVRFERQTAAETDDTGTYRLFDLPAGDYVIGRARPRVILAAPGRVVVPAAVEEAPRDYYPHTTQPEEAQVLTLAAGSETAGIDFIVAVPPLAFRPVPQPPARRGTLAAIRGRVVHADGLPVRGARVEASSADERFSPRSTATDDDGRYELNLPAGDYFVEANDARFSIARFGETHPMDRGTIVTVKGGEVAERIDMSMPRPIAIAGRVLDEFGDPLEKVTMVAQQLRWSAGRLRLAGIRGAPYARTDDRGRFRLFALPPGRFVVRADLSMTPATKDQPYDASDYAPTFFPGTTIPAEAQTVELGPDTDALSVDFALVRGRTARVSGRVLRADGQPFDGNVHLIGSARSGAIVGMGSEHTTTDHGTFAFGNLTPGEYVIQAATSRDGVSREGELCSSSPSATTMSAT
jgi:protocatechuate 3,4-dioxygenase beta subunit